MVSGFFCTIASTATKEQTVAAGWSMLAFGAFTLAASLSGDAASMGLKETPLNAWTTFCTVWGILILFGAGEKPEKELVAVSSLSTPFKVLSIIFFANFCMFVFAPKMSLGIYIDESKYAAKSKMHMENQVQ